MHKNSACYKCLSGVGQIYLYTYTSQRHTNWVVHLYLWSFYCLHVIFDLNTRIFRLLEQKWRGASKCGISDLNHLTVKMYFREIFSLRTLSLWSFWECLCASNHVLILRVDKHTVCTSSLVSFSFWLWFNSFYIKPTWELEKGFKLKKNCLTKLNLNKKTFLLGVEYAE